MTHFHQEGIERPDSPQYLQSLFPGLPKFDMSLKLYGWFASTPSLVIALILREKQIPFEWIEVDLPKGEHKQPNFVANNPFGQVPTIDDDGFVMYESRAIARYLDEKYPNQGTQLFSKDLQKRALVDQVTWAEQFHFHRYGSPIMFQVLNARFFGLETGQNTVEEAKKNLLAKMDIYEGILSKQKYLAGDKLTLADIVHIPAVSRLVEEVKLDLGEGRPNVQRWLNEIINEKRGRK
ncbi:hypothetical protein D9756_008515 [Leucocoprinus leucothites]|uniref:glutathione transferase n=1 Tax=Leucocoprinus leucothites TaxID=201217 RepID=A0A8H5CYV8_9AGAR|nr:hypothetical protein D9756_008515 [Leucoagaricus leucothites]